MSSLAKAIENDELQLTAGFFSSLIRGPGLDLFYGNLSLDTTDWDPNTEWFIVVQALVPGGRKNGCSGHRRFLSRIVHKALVPGGRKNGCSGPFRGIQSGTGFQAVVPHHMHRGKIG
jgi:hypothetical protein